MVVGTTTMACGTITSEADGGELFRSLLATDGNKDMGLVKGGYHM